MKSLLLACIAAIAINSQIASAAELAADVKPATQFSLGGTLGCGQPILPSSSNKGDGHVACEMGALVAGGWTYKTAYAVALDYPTNTLLLYFTDNVYLKSGATTIADLLQVTSIYEIAATVRATVAIHSPDGTAVDGLIIAK